ncbi:hypothetical protein Tco_0847363 [Tanacetum coccineum]
MPLSTYLNFGLGELADTKLTVELGDRTVKYPKGIAENMLVSIGKFVFPVDFIILDMLEDVKITLRVGDEKIIFKSVKPASSLIKRVYMLSLIERMELDLEARLIGETLVLNRSLDPLYGDYIELNDLNVRLELRRDQVDNLMPTIEEGEVIDEPMIDIIKTRNNECFEDENMVMYRDQDMGDIILREPFYKASCVKARRRLLKTLSLDESRSPEFNLFFDLEEYYEEEVTQTMAETMEQYMSRIRADYGSGIGRPKIDDKDSFELKGQFLKELRDNTFSDLDHEDANEHIAKILGSKGAIPSKTAANAKDVNNVIDPTTPKIAHSRKKVKPSKKLNKLNLVDLSKEEDIEQQLQDSTRGTMQTLQIRASTMLADETKELDKTLEIQYQANKQDKHNPISSLLNGSTMRKRMDLIDRNSWKAYSYGALHIDNSNPTHISLLFLLDLKITSILQRQSYNMGLWYPKDFRLELIAYSDADHAGSKDDCKRTSGGLQFLGEKLMSWSSKK